MKVAMNRKTLGRGVERLRERDHVSETHPDQRVGVGFGPIGEQLLGGGRALVASAMH